MLLWGSYYEDVVSDRGAPEDCPPSLSGKVLKVDEAVKWWYSFIEIRVVFEGVLVDEDWVTMVVERLGDMFFSQG
jgi:hypothetical protein